MHPSPRSNPTHGADLHPARRGRPRQFTSFALPIALVAALLSLVDVAPASAADPCGAGGNQISCENSKPGTDPAVWDVDGSGDPSIQGFSTDISVNVGNRIDFKINTNARSYTIDLYRTGWYQGLGARKVASVTPTATLPQAQPQCISDATTELYDCGNWGVSARWDVPSTAVSGVYFALLTRTDTGGQSQIVFVVRDTARHSDILFQTSDPTWEAYNAYGGSDFYQGTVNGRAYKISYNRPFVTRGGESQRDFYFGNEYAAVRFLERNGYDVTYFSGVDTDRFGGELKNHRVFLSVGHDEYWSAAQRANVTAARDAGVNLQFLSGNEIYWHTRYEPSVDPSKTPYRTLVSYKETKNNAKIDPSPEWTGTWRDPRFASQANGAGLPENGLSGTLYMSNFSDLAVTVSAAEGQLRLWRNTSLTSLAPGTSQALAPHTIGYESDESPDNGFRPAGLIDLSTTTGAVSQYLQDFGNTVAPGTTTHHLTMYRAASGALVFSAGSIQWSWGLDQTHDGDGAPADPRMQQAQVNLLADMGALPTTLMAGLVPATASTDVTAPVTTISSPTSGASVAGGSLVTVNGSATDAGGKVAGVEVSTDGGASWHPATGTTSWSYRYYQQGSGQQAVLARAVDDSGNFASTPASASLTVTAPFSVFGAEPPATPDAGDGSAVELGLRFTPATDGFITGVRFFKSTANTGTHTGTLWSASGTQLASVTFSGESASGWQTASFASAVAVSAGQSYVVSYSAPRGHYAAQPYYWAYFGRTRGPLTVAGGFGVPPAGVYSTTPGSFPSDSFENGNYFVDAVFTDMDSSPLVATGQSPLPGSSSVNPATTISALLSRPVVASSVGIAVTDAQGSPVAGAVGYDATSRKATFTPNGPLAAGTRYAVILSATDTSGQPISAGQNWSFTTALPPAPANACPCSLFDDGTVPTVVTSGDPSAVTLGVRFTAQTNGQVTGVKFYKGPTNTGTHVGSLWSASGTLLASATFVAESTAGWQTVTFSSPVRVTAGTEYLAAYRTTVGQYSVTLGTFSDAYLHGPLTVPANGGAYNYSDGFPGTRVSTNYLVDLVFQPDSPTISVVSTTPANGATGVNPAASVDVTLSAAVADGYQLSLGVGTTTVPGTLQLSADRATISFVPSQPLPYSTRVDVSLTGVKSTTGATLPAQSWSFTTAAAPPQSTQEFSLLTGQLPAVPAATDDALPVELGMSFTPSVAGSVTAIRFYKGVGNTGTHIGSLWSSTGQRLASVTFAGESASGWQSAPLSTPVALTAGASYVVSYFAPNGHYAYTSKYFVNPITSGPLTAGTNTNGRFFYGSAGGFPSASWQASNYFVDLVFSTTALPAPAPITVTTTTPASGSTTADPTQPITAVLSADSTGSTPVLGLTNGAGSIAGTSSYDSTSRTVTFRPASPLAWSSSYTATVTIGGTVPSGGSWTFTTVAQPATATGLTIFAQDALPANPNWDDTSAVQVGVRFSSTVAGTVTGIRFYKGLQNTGAHQGYLWSSTGSLLATVAFSGETASGWQSATFNTPVAIQPGVEYRASYHSTTGRYAVTLGGLSSPVTNGPLSTPASGAVYVYGTSYPASTSNHNFWVDVYFVPAG